MENLEMVCFEIIVHVGLAKSLYIEAISEAKLGNFEKAEALIKEGEESFVLGHRAHAKLVEEEADGNPVQVNLILLHAEDQLMNADGFKVIAREFIEVYKKLEERDKK